MTLLGGLRPADLVNFGALTERFPREQLTKLLEETGRRSQRRTSSPRT